MDTTSIKQFAIFGTDNGHTHLLQYVAEGEDTQDAFQSFSDDILSDTGEEEGWDWHVYEIPSEELSEEEIYEYIDGQSPTVITT
jgi:hypothetical protein